MGSTTDDDANDEQFDDDANDEEFEAGDDSDHDDASDEAFDGHDERFDPEYNTARDEDGLPREPGARALTRVGIGCGTMVWLVVAVFGTSMAASLVNESIHPSGSSAGEAEGYLAALVILFVTPWPALLAALKPRAGIAMAGVVLTLYAALWTYAFLYDLSR